MLTLSENNGFGVAPPRRLCEKALFSFSRFGEPSLARNAFSQLISIGVSPEKWYYSMLVDAAAEVGDIQSCLHIVSIMKESNLDPDLVLFDSLRKKLGEGDLLHESMDAYFQTIQENKIADVCYMNIFISAQCDKENLEAANTLYKNMDTYNCKPNLETFKVLLECCLKVSNFGMGQKYIRQMSQFEIEDDKASYELKIALFLLREGIVLDAAFTVLEDMKAAGFKPSENIYLALIKKCKITGDQRARYLFEEMNVSGYNTKLAKKLLNNSKVSIKPRNFTWI